MPHRGWGCPSMRTHAVRPVGPVVMRKSALASSYATPSPLAFTKAWLDREE